MSAKRKYGAAMAVTRRPASYFKQLRMVRMVKPGFRRGGYRTRYHTIPSGKRSHNYMSWHGPGFVPMNYKCPMDYSYLYKTTDATGFYDWTLRGNSVYDPDPALGGDSATGFDVMSGIWYQYKVTGSRCTIDVINNDTDDPVYVAVIPNRNSGAFVVANKNAMMGQPCSRMGTVANQAGEKSITNYMSSKVIFCVKDLDSVNFASQVDTNPATLWYWHVVLYNNSGNALNCELKLHITYYTEFSYVKAAVE